MKPGTEQDYRERITRTLVYIDQRLDQDLNLDQVAAVAAFSKFHFHRIFRGMVGETVSEHVRRLRLERAAGRLKRSADSITQIAFDAGFDAHESFTRAFAEKFGVPPSAYRAAHLADLAEYRPPDYGEPPRVEIRDLPAAKVVFLRHTGAYERVGETWGKLMGWAGPRGLLGPGMKLIGISHDDPDVTPGELLRYDAAIAIARPVAPEGDFGIVELAGGAYAVLTHKGPYDHLPKAYQQFYGGWLLTSGRELRDAPAFEVYLNSPMSAQPADLLTEIHLPVV